MGFLIAFLALFLLVLAGVSFAAVKLFTARDANGNVAAPGCLLGCATGLALGVIALLGLGAFVLGAAAIVKVRAVDHLIEHAPDVEIGAWIDPQREARHRDPARPLHVVIQWPGHSEPAESIIARIDEIVRAHVRVDGRDVNVPPLAEALPNRELDSDEVLVNVDYTNDESGQPITVVDLAFPIDDDASDDLQEALDDAFDGSNQGMRIRIHRQPPGEPDHEHDGELR